MRSLTISLTKELLAYSVAHSEMVVAEHETSRLRNIGTSIRLTTATDEFEKRKERLLKKIPDGITLGEVLADFSQMVQEASDDSQN